jgi:hypothetical protein
MKRTLLGGWLAASALVLGTTALPAFAQSGPAVPPVKQWSKGDTWDVQMSQQALYMHGPGTAWNTGCRLHFVVTSADNKGATLEVTTIPENRIPEKLLLEYNQKGEVESAKVVTSLGSDPLGEVGERPGVFGLLGVEAFDLSKHPPGKNKDTDPLINVEVGKKGKGHQKWSGGDPFWSEYSSTDDLPQIGKRTSGQWKNKDKK